MKNYWTQEARAGFPNVQMTMVSPNFSELFPILYIKTSWDHLSRRKTMGISVGITCHHCYPSLLSWTFRKALQLWKEIFWPLLLVIEINVRISVLFPFTIAEAKSIFYMGKAGVLIDRSKLTRFWTFGWQVGKSMRRRRPNCIREYGSFSAYGQSPGWEMVSPFRNNKHHREAGRR